jgi:hypothetical protein
MKVLGLSQLARHRSLERGSERRFARVREVVQPHHARFGAVFEYIQLLSANLFSPFATWKSSRSHGMIDENVAAGAAPFSKCIMWMFARPIRRCASPCG